MSIWRRSAVWLGIALVVFLAACDRSPSAPEATPTTTSSTTTTTTVERIVYVYREGGIDALAASPLARRGVVLPVPSCGEAPQETLDALREFRATSVRRIGGPDAVCDEMMRQLEAVVAER
jgi:putative cell wall-binding protein